MANNRICSVDKKEYHYCPTCYNDADKPSWMVSFCCENCKKIFDTLVDETVSKITTSEAKDILGKLDLSNINSFDEDIKNHINRVLSYGKKSVVTLDEEVNSTQQVPKMARRKTR